MKRHESIDYSALSNTITKRAYKLSDVKDQLESVGFDIVRFKDGDKGADLWQIHNAEDGDYIVALYPEEELEKTASCPWSVLASQGKLQVSYKGDPLVRLAASKLGIPETELSKVSSYLPEKLASNKKLVQALLKELTPVAKQEVVKRYPELIA